MVFENSQITEKYNKVMYKIRNTRNIFYINFIPSGFDIETYTQYEKDNQIVEAIGYSHSADWKEKNSTIQIFNNEFNCWGYGSWSEKIIKLRIFVINGELDSTLKNPIPRRKY